MTPLRIVLLEADAELASRIQDARRPSRSGARPSTWC
jgi:hypothetical protein